ncbi:MAG TPA: enoyl-CoA hydratase-related protein [Chitinophagaceae bacterium]|nr:enoyl-CoA hydratase-related protein [Chitinophagaceae bacterium]
MYQYLLMDKRDRVSTITLNRPEVYNAFNDELTYELQDALKQVTKDEEVRVLILTGSGKAFCSGQDLKAAIAQGKRNFEESVRKRYNPIILAITGMPKPVICKLNGVAAGAGCSLALACDMIIAADTAMLTEGFIHIGLVVDSGSAYFLPRTVGYRKAFELASKGSKISASEALQLGLVDKVVSPEELDAAVSSETDYYVSAPAKAIGLLKKMLRKGMVSDLDTMLDYEAWMQQIAGNSSDHKEGVSAFLEKRRPDFQGK